MLRDSSLIFLAGIVGVPWQDIASNPDNLAEGYRPVEQLSWKPEDFTSNEMTPPTGLPEGKTLWNMILGEVDENPGTDTDGDGVIAAGEKNGNYGAIVPTVDPIDPLMKESVEPRTGAHPITGVDLVQPGSGNAVGHPINGSEWTITAQNDLQYACIFDLPQQIDCTAPENTFGCDCGQSPENPLCWNGSSYGTDQLRAKAYPGRRQLAVLKGVGSQAIVASVCPANMSDSSKSDYGYRPAIASIVERLKAALQGTCWSEQLTIKADGTVDCVVLEATKGNGVDGEGNVTCPACGDGRIEASDQQKAALEGNEVFIENGLSCVCQINQAEVGNDLTACQTQEVVTGVKGWCYLDPDQDNSHNPDLVASCPVGGKRLIRFVGDNVPAAGSLTFLQCVGASFGDTNDDTTGE